MTEASINQIYELGDTADLECNSSGGPGNMYQWQFNGDDVNNENLTILRLQKVTFINGGTYSCVVSNPAGNHNVSTHLFISPYFVTQPEEVIYTSAGFSLSIICVAEAFPEPEYQWGHEDEREIRKDILTNVSTLTIPSVQFGDGGNYYCNVTSNGFVNTSKRSLVFGKYMACSQ